VAFHIGTRLPNAKHPSGLGQDTIDFYARAIAGSAVGDVRVTVNAGVGVLGDPMNGHRHVPSLLYGAELSGPITPTLAVVVGGDGRTGPDEPGLESRANARFGFQWTNGGPVFINLSATSGLTQRDGRLGFACNIGYTFQAFHP
jgi:hypothetical protein